MGFLDKLSRMMKGKPLSYFAKQEGTAFHDATCDACGAAFQWLETGVAFPIPLSVSRSKPDRSTLDIGGWCPKCRRMICPDQADFVPFTHGEEDWWVPGCRDCQEPLHGLHTKAMYQAKLAEDKAKHDAP